MEEKKYLWKIIFLLLALFFTLFGISFRPREPEFSKNQFVEAIEVIDGDTIRVRDLKNDKIFTVRYLGIDAPELEGPAYETCFAFQAKEQNENLVLGQKLILEFDQDRYDRFGRILAYVYTLNEFNEKEIFVNLKLLEEGYARFYLDQQNTLWQKELSQAALQAHENFLGLWGSCGEEEFGGKCLIKGNIDRLGNKYYHLPGDKYYAQTKINLLKEEEWLCTIEEAEEKNFQRALQNFHHSEGNFI